MIIHCCLDVRGAMRLADRDLRRLFVRTDGNSVSVQEALDFLCEHVAIGHAVIPLGEECAGFDYQRGCPGHLDESVSVVDVPIHDDESHDEPSRDVTEEVSA